MDLIVNDIENIVLLNKIGIYESLFAQCNSMLVTNVRCNDFSTFYNKEIDSLLMKGLEKVDVDFDFFEYAEIHKHFFKGLWIGDISSIYLSTQNKATIISSNKILMQYAKKLNIRAVETGVFLNKIIEDRNAIEVFNNAKKHLGL